jgi:hypothetical protein
MVGVGRSSGVVAAVTVVFTFAVGVFWELIENLGATRTATWCQYVPVGETQCDSAGGLG